MNDDFLLLALVAAAAAFLLLSKRREPSPEYRLLESRVASLERLAIEGPK